MEKEHKKLVFRLTPWVVLLLLPLLYVDLMWGNRIRFEQQLSGFRSPEESVSVNRIVEERRDESSLEFVLSRLVKDDDRRKLEATGFACDVKIPSMHCVANRPVRIDAGKMTVFVPSDQPPQETTMRPYDRQEDEILLKSVTPVKILTGNVTPPACEYTHDVPAVIFSSSGFVGNVFHEINEIIIPLYITARNFKSRAIFILEDYNPKFVHKYGNVLTKLTSHEILNPAANRSVHCFPGAVVGLKFHGFLAANATEPPTGISTADFRKFLFQSLNLKFRHVSQIKTPTVMLLSRRTTRRIVNEDEVVAMMKELGFRVIVVARAKIVSNLNLFASMINSCSVFVAVHGAGLTNEVFLPDGAVTVQVDLIGLEWAGATYYGNPARGLGVKYIRYKVEPEESSLLKIFKRKDHVAFTDPKGAFPAAAGREIYLNGQNVRINVERFRQTMVQAMSLVTDSSL